MTECGNTFDGLHHWAPRTFGAVQTGNLHTEIGCVCGAKCPRSLLPAVKAALAETDAERARQRTEAQRLTERNAPVGQPRLI